MGVACGSNGGGSFMRRLWKQLQARWQLWQQYPKYQL